MAALTEERVRVERNRNRMAAGLARVLYRAGVPSDRAATLSDSAWLHVADEALGPSPGRRSPSVTTRGVALTIMAALEEFGAPREPSTG